jgi:hypothetical protein
LEKENRMHPSNITVRFEQVAEQVDGPVRRIVGFIRARNMLTLFDAADLEANPRSAKAGPVTDAIIESINETPDTFPFKTKGVLVGASDYDARDRRRYELRFENPRIEGILDGGHNMLAIGSHILSVALGEPRIARKRWAWPEFKDAWSENRGAVTELRRAPVDDQGFDPLGFLIPVEILVPSDIENEDMIDEFKRSLLDICAARNNNVELAAEAKANQRGYYAELKLALPKNIATKVEWKTNDGGTIKVRELIALSWIPLSILTLPEGLRHIKVSPQNIYRNKGECVRLFDELMSNDEVSRPTDGEYTHELNNVSVASALRITGDIPELYDWIYAKFPYAYNAAGGRFGGLDIVKLAEKMRSKPVSHFLGKPVEYAYPDGLIMPLVYGLKALMTLDEHEQVTWKVDPKGFLRSHFDTIVKKYKVILEAFRHDPQKVGKNEGSYDFVLDAFETELMRRRTAA